MLRVFKEDEIKELLSRIARSIGLKLVETYRDAWMDRHWCFSNEKARFTACYFSLANMLQSILTNKSFRRVPGTGDGTVDLKDIYPNPFYGCKSTEEVLVKCDLLGEKE